MIYVQYDFIFSDILNKCPATASLFCKRSNIAKSNTNKTVVAFVSPEIFGDVLL